MTLAVKVALNLNTTNQPNPNAVKNSSGHYPHLQNKEGSQNNTFNPFPKDKF